VLAESKTECSKGIFQFDNDIIGSKMKRSENKRLGKR
jgi:hypothetical protein